ncbi:MAG: LytR C-terminal domain-containing protein [Patescibacteria group bacterium]
MRRTKSTSSTNSRTENVEPIPGTVKGSTKNSPLVVVIIAVVLVTAVILGVKSLWLSNTGKSSFTQDQTQASTSEGIQALISMVAKHISVKTDEDPTVATIQDPDLLRTQNPVFYKEAENGDRLLVWSDKAVLYSVTKDRLLYVLPINLPPAPESDTQVSTTTGNSSDNEQESATIEVRNGTLTAGLAKTVTDKLKKAGLNVLQPGDAKLKNYTSTIIVKNSDNVFSQTVSTLTSLTGGKLEALPEGEKVSTADILVIVGSDFKD